MQVGAQCTDGQGSSGVAVTDVVHPPLEQVIPPPAEVLPPPPPVASSPPAVELVPPPSARPEPLPPVPRLTSPHTDSVPGAAVGASVRGLPGAKWADPKNSGTVTGYTYKGRYHPGPPAGYDPTTATIMSQSGPARAIVQAPGVPASAIVGGLVRGERGAVWADLNNDGVADGYVEDGRYFPGVPPHFASRGDSVTQPPPTQTLSCLHQSAAAASAADRFERYGEAWSTCEHVKFTAPARRRLPAVNRLLLEGAPKHATSRRSLSARFFGSAKRQLPLYMPQGARSRHWFTVETDSSVGMLADRTPQGVPSANVNFFFEGAI